MGSLYEQELPLRRKERNRDRKIRYGGSRKVRDHLIEAEEVRLDGIRKIEGRGEDEREKTSRTRKICAAQNKLLEGRHGEL